MALLQVNSCSFITIIQRVKSESVLSDIE